MKDVGEILTTWMLWPSELLHWAQLRCWGPSEESGIPTSLANLGSSNFIAPFFYNKILDFLFNWIKQMA